MPPPPTVVHGQAKATSPCSPELAGPLFFQTQEGSHLPIPGLPLPLTAPVTEKVRNRWALTSGLKGGSSMPASSLLKLRCLKRGCSFTSLAPAPRHPRRSKGSLHRSCDTKEINVLGEGCSVQEQPWAPTVCSRESSGARNEGSEPSHAALTETREAGCHLCREQPWCSASACTEEAGVKGQGCTAIPWCTGSGRRARTSPNIPPALPSPTAPPPPA